MPSNDPFDDPFFKEPFRNVGSPFDRNVRSNSVLEPDNFDKWFNRLFKGGIVVGCAIYFLIAAAIITAIILAWKQWG